MRRLATTSFFVASLALAAWLGCADSPGLPVLPDATREVVSTDTGVADTMVSDSGGDAAVCTASPGTGSTFTDLYRDIISDTPKAAARCQNSACHGAPDGQAGLKMGKTKDSAYAAITTFITLSFHKDPKDASSPLLPLAKPGSTDPSESGILRVLGPTSAGGYMPYEIKSTCGTVPAGCSGVPCNRRLVDAELENIKGWLKNGAKND